MFIAMMDSIQSFSELREMLGISLNSETTTVD